MGTIDPDQNFTSHCSPLISGPAPSSLATPPEHVKPEPCLLLSKIKSAKVGRGQARLPAVRYRKPQLHRSIRLSFPVRVLEPIPGSSGLKAWMHPGWDTGLSPDKTTHLIRHYGQFEMPVSLTACLWTSGGKSSTQRKHANSERTCKLHMQDHSPSHFVSFQHNYYINLIHVCILL